MNDFECIQTWVTANPVGIGDATLRVLQGSHIYHGEFREKFKLPNEKMDWHVLTDEQIQWLKDKGCKDLCLVAPPGAQVCWDR